MFNLLVAHGADSWNEGKCSFPKNRVAIEYTEDSISERYKDLQADVLHELKEIPSLFCVEGEKASSHVGFITDIRVGDSNVTIEFSFEEGIPPLKEGSMEKMFIPFGLGRLEMYRTHWAIKEGDLFPILANNGFMSPQDIPPKTQKKKHQQPSSLLKVDSNLFNKDQVFIVHGHDDVVKYEMASAIKELGLKPIILDEQASGGMTIIEKIEHYSDVGFAVILYTPCDFGAKIAKKIELLPRARQNVVFEHGYLIGKLKRNRVMAFVKDMVETPNDISGVLYIEYDKDQNWKDALKKELKKAGYSV
jgi:predicted nucleotide-binding protein